MDEITIEEKKYISSKRAAKITGYAKDYIGQLCREGRVPARLVGRNWYVLETAIQDHRFGDTESELKHQEPAKFEERAKIVESETPKEMLRYESAPEQVPMSDATKGIQESWQAWFDRFDNESIVRLEEEELKTEPEPAVVKEEHEEEEPEEQSVAIDIPIHVQTKEVHTAMIPTDLLPWRHIESQPHDSEGEEDPVLTTKKQTKRGPSRAILTTIQTCGVLLAIVTFVSAVIGSGYFDKYALSNKQVMMIAGVSLYNK